MYKNLLFAALFFFTLFIGGCSEKNIEINAQTEQAILSTQKARVDIDGKSTLLIMATYMNNMKKYFEAQNDIIVLSYYSSFLNEDNTYLKEPVVLINGKSAEVKKIEKDDEILKDLPSSNIWSKYYIVSSKKDDAKSLNLSVEIYPFEMVLLMFPKGF